MPARDCYLNEIHEDGGSGVLYGDVSIWRCGERKGKKIYDLRKTLIIPIHKAQSILVRRYAVLSATSGLIKNDDRKGRKLHGAYRPINSTSASICLSLSPFLLLRVFSPFVASRPIPFHYVPQNLCNYRRQVPTKFSLNDELRSN